jgi:hypothetical protein
MSSLLASLEDQYPGYLRCLLDGFYPFEGYDVFLLGKVLKSLKLRA